MIFVQFGVFLLFLLVQRAIEEINRLSMMTIEITHWTRRFGSQIRFRNKAGAKGCARGVRWTTYGEHDVPHTLCVSGHPLPDVGCDLRYFFGNG